MPRAGLRPVFPDRGQPVLSRAASIPFDGPLGARIAGLSHAGSRAAAHWLAEAAYDINRVITRTNNGVTVEVAICFPTRIAARGGTACRAPTSKTTSFAQAFTVTVRFAAFGTHVRGFAYWVERYLPRKSSTQPDGCGSEWIWRGRSQAWRSDLCGRTRNRGDSSLVM